MILARTFGRVDVDAFLSELEPSQFDEWNAAYLVDPWGPERLDAAIARLAVRVEALGGGSGEFEDFHLRPGPFEQLGTAADTGPQQTAEEQAAILRNVFAIPY